MGTYYETWLQKERDWAKAEEDKRKKQAYFYGAVTVIGSVAALAGIGLLAAGIEAAISNIKYGLILGVFSGGLYLVIMLASGMGGKYMKRLEKEIAGELKSEVEREEFACGMLGGADGKEPVACMEFTEQKGAVPNRFSVSGNFALFRGMTPCLVRLDKTEKMEMDVIEGVSTIRAGDYKIRLNYNSYPISFYYYKSQSEATQGKKRKLDKMIVFPSRELRDEAVKMMNRQQQ